MHEIYFYPYNLKRIQKENKLEVHKKIADEKMSKYYVS
jgi:hypothetical protein